MKVATQFLKADTQTGKEQHIDKKNNTEYLRPLVRENGCVYFPSIIFYPKHRTLSGFLSM